ncbi:MAG: hypothetical protein JO264_06510 [Acidisphaera sp.]|nr:hypothetical protein [Acidisphaera sp.]
MDEKKPGKAGAPGVAARLRDAIDRGRTGDKVKADDPAAAPLGTDAEAGSSHDEEGLRVAREAGRKPPSA